MMYAEFVPDCVDLLVFNTRTRSNTADAVEPNESLPVDSVVTAERSNHTPDPPIDPCSFTAHFVEVVTLSNDAYTVPIPVGKAAYPVDAPVVFAANVNFRGLFLAIRDPLRRFR